MQMGPSWSQSTSSPGHANVVDCLTRLRSKSSATGFGYKMQALAAHVLLAMNHRVVEVKRTSHPDIVSVKDGQEFGFEVEAEVLGNRKRMLTSSDFKGLTGSAGVIGYFALAVSFPKPYWVLVPARRLARRNLPSGNALLEALSDKEFSSEWTHAYFALVDRSCKEMLDWSFEQLVQRAKSGAGL